MSCSKKRIMVLYGKDNKIIKKQIVSIGSRSSIDKLIKKGYVDYE